MTVRLSAVGKAGLRLFVPIMMIMGAITIGMRVLKRWRRDSTEQNHGRE
jgi:hypothetical protein